MNHALRKGTRFWIVEPGLEGGGLGGLLSGTYVGIAPGDEGDETREFVGQEYPPVLSAPEAGKTFILEDRELGSVAVGSPVQYQGMRVGRVLGTEYDEKRGITAVHVFVVQRFANNVRQSTRFFRARRSLPLARRRRRVDGRRVALVAAQRADRRSTRRKSWPERRWPKGRASSFTTRARPRSPRRTDRISPTSPTSPDRSADSTPGTPVQMKGVQVGRVRDVRLRYVPQTATLETPVMLEIDPRELEFNVTDATTRADLRATMNDALAEARAARACARRWPRVSCCRERARSRSTSSPSRERDGSCSRTIRRSSRRPPATADWTARWRRSATSRTRSAACRCSEIAGHMRSTVAAARHARQRSGARSEPAAPESLARRDREGRRSTRRDRTSTRSWRACATPPTSAEAAAKSAEAADRHLAEAELRRRGADPRTDARGRSGARAGDLSHRKSRRAAQGEARMTIRRTTLLHRCCCC